MGIYPVAPGSNAYVIASPLLESASIDVGPGKTFTIEAKNNSVLNKYIKSATLNGKPFNRTWITHDEIMKGGELLFEMAPEPNTKWGTGREATPPSMTMIK
jgi:putative alpha-1,2-mannosidase